MIESVQEETGRGDDPDAAHRSRSAWQQIFKGTQAQLPGLESSARAEEDDES